MTHLLPLTPCPWGCGAQLHVHPTTAEGERLRCGGCRQPTVWARGALLAPLGPLEYELPNPGDEAACHADMLYH